MAAALRSWLFGPGDAELFLRPWLYMAAPDAGAPRVHPDKPTLALVGFYFICDTPARQWSYGLRRGDFVDQEPELRTYAMSILNGLRVLKTDDPSIPIRGADQERALAAVAKAVDPYAALDAYKAANRGDAPSIEYVLWLRDAFY